MGRTSDARERLIESAKHLLAARGYGAVGVNDLCEQAGVRKGSFYHFFASKQELCITAIEAHWRELEQGIDATCGTGGPAIDRLLCLLRSHCESNRHCHERNGAVHGCMFANLALELSHLDDQIRAVLDATFSRWSGRYAALIGEAMADAAIPPGDPARLAHDLLAFVEGHVLLAKARNDPESLGAVEAGARRLLGLPGLARSPAAERGESRN